MYRNIDLLQKYNSGVDDLNSTQTSEDEYLDSDISFLGNMSSQDRKGLLAAIAKDLQQRIQ